MIENRNVHFVFKIFWPLFHFEFTILYIDIFVQKMKKVCFKMCVEKLYLTTLGC